MTRLRAVLALAPIPPHVGTELRTITPRLADQVVRLLRQEPTYAALSPDGRKRLLAVVVRAMEEFAALVEDRPLRGPAVETMLLGIVHAEGQLEPCHAALHASFLTVRQVTRVLWPQLPLARNYSSQLDMAIARYAERLCTRTMNAPPAAVSRPVESRPSDESQLDSLFSLVKHRWGGEAGQLFVSVRTLSPTDVPVQRRVTQHPLDIDPARGVRVTITDHVVIVTKHPAPAPRAAGTTDSPIMVCTGPVPATEIAVVHDTALLLLRLIGAGIAAPPSPVRVALPNLGFLHPCPSPATVRKIAELLQPLIEQSLHRRIALARTLQLRLRTAGTVQGLAKQLEIHPQTVHNHLAALRTMYNADLAFGEETLPMQAALDLVLPLWELEAKGSRRQRMSGNSPETNTVP